MQKVTLGNSSIQISRLGLGCMGMSAFYSPSERDDQNSLETIKSALDCGINFFDTSDVYGPHTNEELLGTKSLFLTTNEDLYIPILSKQLILSIDHPHLVGRAIKRYGREKFVIATKFGVKIENGNFVLCATPQYVKEACEGSLKRLGVSQIDLYYLHRVDPNTPIEDTVRAMADLVKEGKVKSLGLSEVSADTLRRAQKIYPISALQNQTQMLQVCKELGVTFVAYSPLGRGFLTGQITKPEDLGEDDYRKHLPRFQPQNFPQNIQLVDKVKEIANKKGCTPAQLALAWVMDHGPHVVPIPGTKNVKYLRENVRSLEVHLTDEEKNQLNEIVSAFPVAGERYDEKMMAAVNQ